MGKEILTFGNIETEKNKFYQDKDPNVLGDVDIKKVLVSKKFLLLKKTISTLLVTCIMVIKLNITYNAFKNKRLCKKLRWTD